MTVLDWSFAWRAIDLDAARYVADGVIRYLGGPKGPTITAPQVDELRGHGFDLGFVFQQNGDEPLHEGAAAGVRHAHRANAEADELGVPGDVAIYFACDTDARRAWGNSLDYFRAARAVCSRPVGAYVGDDMGAVLLDEGTIEYLWQPSATSWSSVYPFDRAHLVQRLGQPWELGGAYDYNTVNIPTWGQWYAPGNAPDPVLEEEPPVQLSMIRCGEVSNAVFVTDGLARRAIGSPEELDELVVSGIVKPGLTEVSAATLLAIPDVHDVARPGLLRRLFPAKSARAGV